jgi:NitT/TauT family transport system permease protein
MRRLRRLIAKVAPPFVAIALALAVWEVAVRVFAIPVYLLPSPSASAATFFALLSAGWTEPSFVGGAPTGLLRDAYITLLEAVIGLAVGTIVGVTLGVLMAMFRFAEQSLYPVASAVRATPIIAIAPIFIIWFGVDVAPKAAVAALATFFPILVNVITGLRSIDPSALELLRSLNASKREILWRLRIPSALPHFFAAMRLAVSLSLIGATVGELVGSREGLGHMITLAAIQLRTTEVFSGVVMLAGMGIVLTEIVAIVQSRVLYWHESERTAQIAPRTGRVQRRLSRA